MPNHLKTVLDKIDFIQNGAIVKVFIDIASNIETTIYDKKLDFDNIAIINAQKKKISGTLLGTLIGYFVSQRNSVLDSNSGKAATSDLASNNVCATG